MKLRVLVDDNTIIGKYYVVETAISYWIEAERKQVLEIIREQVGRSITRFVKLFFFGEMEFTKQKLSKILAFFFINFISPTKSED